MALWVEFTHFDGPYRLEEDCPESGIGLGDGIVRPDFQPRLTYAPDSMWVPGKQLLSFVAEASEIRIPLIAKGPSSTVIDTHVEALETVLWQFSYEATVHEDGSERTWPCEPAVPTWGPITALTRHARARVGQVSIPLNPR